MWTKEELLSGNDDDDDDDDNGDVIWTHKSGRVTLIVGDVLKKRPTLNNSFDAVYDKDSFGALPIELRAPFCARIAEYTKEQGIVYLECKLKKKKKQQKERHTVTRNVENGGSDGGSGSSVANSTTSNDNNNMLWDPPYSLEKEDLIEDDNYGGTKFDYVEQLGVVYDLHDHTVNTVMEQTGHILRRRCTRNSTHSSE